MMVDFRANPPKSLLGSQVVKINDFKTLESLDVKSGVNTYRSGRQQCVAVVHRRWHHGIGTSVGNRAED